MSVDDNRDVITFYGFYPNDWTFTFGDFSNTHYLLDKEYISDGCSTLESSRATLTRFLYPHHIKKTYFLEGVIRGHITLAASGCSSHVTSYKVSVGKIHEDTTDTPMATTNYVTVDKTLSYYTVGNGVNEEVVYPFWIDVINEQKITDKERIYVKVDFVAESTVTLYHSNDSTWEDLKIELPFRL